MLLYDTCYCLTIKEIILEIMSETIYLQILNQYLKLVLREGIKMVHLVNESIHI